jgi:hypothetical protein
VFCHTLQPAGGKISCSIILSQKLILLPILRKFRALIITVSRRLLEQQSACSPRDRVDGRTLTLTAGLIYFINATQNRPASGRAQHTLLCCLLPLTDTRGHPDLISGRDGNPWANQDDEGRDSSGPMVPTGMFHMRPLRLSDESVVPRMETHDEHRNPHPILPRDVYPQLFGLTFTELTLKYGNNNYAPRPTKRPVRSRGPAPWVSAQSLQSSGVIPPEFTQEQMDRFLGKKHKALSDDEDDDYGGQGEDDVNLKEQFSTIWGSFPSQVLTVIPSPKGHHSLTVYHNFHDTSHNDEEPVGDAPPRNENWFRHMNSNEIGGPDGFTRCSLRTADIDDWNRCFDYLFPGKNQIDPASPKNKPELLVFNMRSQGYPQATYHTNWITMMKESTRDDAKFLRDQIRSRFDQLRWVPFANKAKMWETRRDTHKDAITLPPGDAHKNEACPRICINPLFAHILTWDGHSIPVSKRLRIAQR